MIQTFLILTPLGYINVVVSNGPGTALPVIWILLLNRIILLRRKFKLIFIESFCRVKTLSASGLILYHMRVCDKFVVHWEEQAKKFKRSVYQGILI